MIIAVDFDGTIVDHKYPAIGKEKPFAFDALKQLQNQNHILILWTVREGELLQEAIDFCAKNGLTFYAHNANFPEEDRSIAARKLKADLFIDDRNFGGRQDWPMIYRIIQEKKTFELSFPEQDQPDEIKKKKKWGIFG